MPKGLAIPIGVNSKGGASLVDGDANDTKIIKLALGSDDNQNAFQQGIGVGLDMIFDINDPTTRPAIQGRINRVFEKFEAQRRYKLIDNTLSWEQNESELILNFKYVSLEADEERLFRQSFSASSETGNVHG